MVRELNQSSPIHAMLKNLLYTRGQVPVRIAPATGQNQVQLGAENTGVRTYRDGRTRWHRMSQGDVVGTTHDPQAAKAERTSDRKRYKPSSNYIRRSLPSSFTRPVPSKPSIRWVTFMGTQRRNSGLTLRLSQDWAVGYRGICGKRLSDRLNPALERTFEPIVRTGNSLLHAS